MNRSVLIGIVCLLPLTVVAAEPRCPTTIAELFADFDPRKEPLDAKLLREWETDGIVTRTVTFHVGTFKGTPARLAAFYAFPKGAKQAAALLNLHGGGQRAALHEAEFYARRGYACLSVNHDVLDARHLRRRGRECDERKQAKECRGLHGAAKS